MYNVLIKRKAQKALSRVPVDYRGKIIKAIQALRNNPFPEGCKKLTGREAWRIRLGTYRLIYEVDQEKQDVLIILIGHRKEVYR